MRKFVLLLTIVLGIWFGADIIAHAQTNPYTNLPSTIIEFRTPTENLVLTELENEGVSLEFYWQVTNFETNQRIFIEQYQDNDWVVVVGDKELLRANDMVEILATHPRNFTAPTYRLVVRAEDGNILTQRSLVIPYTVDTTLLPHIQNFRITETKIYADSGPAGDEQIVYWNVENRLPNTNLVLTQVISPDETINIDLHSAELWIPSIGQSVVNLSLPSHSDSITLHLQLVNVLNGEVYDEAYLSFTIN